MKNEAENKGTTAPFLFYHSPDPLAQHSGGLGILPRRKVTWGECDANDPWIVAFHWVTGVKLSGDSKGGPLEMRGTFPGLNPPQIRLWHPKKKLIFHYLLTFKVH